MTRLQKADVERVLRVLMITRSWQTGERALLAEQVTA